MSMLPLCGMWQVTQSLPLVARSCLAFGALFLRSPCSVTTHTRVNVLAAWRELYTHMRVVAGDTAHLARLHITVHFSSSVPRAMP